MKDLAAEVQIPIEADHWLHDQAGHRSEMKPATLIHL